MRTENHDRIELRLPSLPCRIGVLPGENEWTQPVRVELTVDLDLSMAPGRGLDSTLDYAGLHRVVRERVLSQRWDLVEALAGALLEDALADERVRRAHVMVEKCAPPLGIGAGPVRIHMTRSRGGAV